MLNFVQILGSSRYFTERRVRSKRTSPRRGRAGRQGIQTGNRAGARIRLRSPSLKRSNARGSQISLSWPTIIERTQALQIIKWQEFMLSGAESDLEWQKESHPVWDEPKQRIIGDAPAGTFDRRYAELESGSAISGEWWGVVADNRVIGYGWLDVVWGDAEILFAVDPVVHGHGIGRFIVEQLDGECRSRNLNYMYNVVSPSHPRSGWMTAWLIDLGFQESSDRTLTRAVTRS